MDNKTIGKKPRGTMTGSNEDHSNSRKKSFIQWP